MDAEILLISITLIVCAFFIAMIRLVLRCADETDEIDYIGLAQVANEEKKEEAV